MIIFLSNVRLAQARVNFASASIGLKQITSPKAWIVGVKTLKGKGKFL